MKIKLVIIGGLIVSIASFSLSVGASDRNLDLGQQIDNPARVSQDINLAFKGFKAESNFYLQYDDLDYIYRKTVLDMGNMGRAVTTRAHPPANSRVLRGSNSKYRLEGNRVDFKALSHPDNLAVLLRVRQNLEAIPSNLPLRELSKEEQLAYWLNLYNVTLVREIAEVYPKKKLRKFLVSSEKRMGILDKKILNVAGIALSLNDIQHKILIPEYKNPLVMYGLFQGVIGGPNLRNEAYRGKKIYQQLQENAKEFINSNRGTRSWRSGEMRVSYFYTVNRELFPNFDTDLKNHLLRHSNGDYAEKITNANEFRAKINDWYIADLFEGTMSRGNSSNTNLAALLGSVKSQDGDVSDNFIRLAQKFSIDNMRFPPHVMDFIKKKKEELIKRKRNVEGEVTVDELEADDSNQ